MVFLGKNALHFFGRSKRGISSYDLFPPRSCFFLFFCSGPMAVDAIKTENLYEDLHWIVLIIGYVLSDKVTSEKSLIPDQVMMYSIAESENVNLEFTVKHLTSLGSADSGKKSYDFSGSKPVEKKHGSFQYHWIVMETVNQ